MIFFARRFKQDIRELSKKYRHIRSDLQTTLEEISQGNLIGNQISGVGYPVFKVRIKNSDINKGKSGGYRLIYYIYGGICTGEGQRMTETLTQQRFCCSLNYEYRYNPLK